MISAPNHLPRLNGSRYNLLFIFIGLLFFSSGCELFRKVPKSERQGKGDGENLEVIEGRRVFNKTTGKWEYTTRVDEPMDTVQWTFLPENDSDISSSEETRKMEEAARRLKEKKTDFKIAYLLPFLSNRFNPLDINLDPRSELFLQFYEGARLALDSFHHANHSVNLEIFTYDTQASPTKVTEILKRPELQEMDLIIGPYRSVNIAKVADFTRQHQQIMISPFSSEGNQTTNNPRFIQFTPSLKAHSRAMMQDIHEQFPDKRVVVVIRDKADELSRVPFFREAALLASTNPTFADSIRTLIVSAEDEDFSREVKENEPDVLEPYLVEGDTTVFVVPSWSNESFVYSFLRKLHIVRGDNPVVVYGMPQWQQFELVSYDYYEKLNVRISSAQYIDKKRPEVREFNRLFLEKYGALPIFEAYLGFDVTAFMVEALEAYGSEFIEELDQLHYTGLQNDLHFERVAPEDPNVEMNPDQYDYQENTHVNILEFKNYQFQCGRHPNQN